MKTILFQGDSITDCNRFRKENPDFFERVYKALMKRKTLGEGYPLLVTEELESKQPGQFRFVNKGVSGDRIPDVYARIVRDIIKIKPDYMSILIGVNDIWHGFDFDNETGIERFEKVYNMLIEELKEEFPNLKIMLLEPFILEGSATSNREGQPERYKNFRSGIEQVAVITKRLAEKHNLKFVELQALFDEAATKVSPSELLSDGVHPTKKGHELIKEQWLKAFDEIV